MQHVTSAARHRAAGAPVRTRAHATVRLPGLFRLGELEDVLDPSSEYDLVRADRGDDGIARYAVYWHPRRSGG